MRVQHLRCLLVGATALALAACGGGGVESTPFVPTPPAPPPPPPPPPADTATSVNIFPSPTPGEYVSVGASVAGPGGNLDEYDEPTMFDTVSAAGSEQPHIRYTAGGYYEIKMPGSDWDKLIFYKGSYPDDPTDFNYFQPASVKENYGYLLTDQARKQGYTYSELAVWGSDAAGRWGYVAFGSPTASQDVPTTGHADFAGFAQGSTDIMTADSFYGGYVPVGVGGDVRLSFDFAAGSLAGSMSLSFSDGMQSVQLGTYAFEDTVFSVGSPTYSGKFDTNVAGDNFFLGRFTGPNAEETIGAWALPFVFTTGGETLQADNKVHQAFGAWIAKRGN